MANAYPLKIILILTIINVIHLNSMYAQDTIRIVDGNPAFFVFTNEQYALKDTAENAHYMIYSRYIESILVREFDVVNRKLEGKDVTYNFPYDFPYSIIHWKKGILDGRYTLYNGDTIPDFEIEMEGGWPNGEYAKYEIVGDTVLKVLHGHFKKGIMDSIWTQYTYTNKYLDYQYVQTYSFENGELIMLSFKPVNGEYTLLQGTGFICTNNLDTAFYKMGRLYKWIDGSRYAYSNSKFTNISKINSEGVVNKAIYSGQGSTRFEHPFYESNYLIVDNYIDTTLEYLENSSIQYINLQKKYKLIPHGTFSGYYVGLKHNPNYYINHLTEQFPVYNSLLNNPYVEDLNFINYPVPYSKCLRQYQYGKLVGTANFTQSNKIIELNALEQKETRKNLLEDQSDEIPIYFAISGNIFFLHFSSNLKKLSLLNTPEDTSDITVRITYDGLIFSPGPYCDETLVGYFDIIGNYLTFKYTKKVFNIQYPKYQFYRPFKISSDIIYFKGDNDFNLY